MSQMGQGRSGWTFFEDLDLVLGCKPSTEPSVMLESTKGLAVFKEYAEMQQVPQVCRHKLNLFQTVQNVH